MGPLNQIIKFRYFLAGLIWLGLISLAHGASTEKIESELALVRENLRISEVTAARIAARLEDLKQSGQVSSEIINDYEIYLARVKSMVDENSRVVRRMETAYTNHFYRKESTNPNISNDFEDMLNPNIPEEQTVNEVVSLDREFNDSLADFDEMLLKEFDAIRARSEAKMRDLAEEAAEVKKRLKEKGIELNTDESEPSSEAEEHAEDVKEKDEIEKELPDEEKGSDSEKGSSGKDLAVREKASDGDQDPSRDKKNVYEKEDDDIVARQLREAAENETDPELKEKLWKEYEDYKKNRR